MDLPKIRTVVPDAANPEGDRLVLLRMTKEADIPPETDEYLKKESKGLTIYDIELDYDYWTADEILQAFLPPDLRERSPTGFAMTGHIAHVNLNDEYLPYKHIIGQLILEKNKKVKTVVNKLNNIDTQFRFFKMELIAGDPDFVVEHHESDCRFTFDFSQVYWNSRLHTEHDRLVRLFNPTEVVADVFAGVGPFAVPAAKKGCAVLANDLNPNSEKYLAINVKNNQVTDLVRTFCQDGRDFICQCILELSDNPFPPYTGPKLSRVQEEKKRRRLQKLMTEETTAAADTPSTKSLPPRRYVSHFVMNLPDSAIQFLDAFRGLLNDSTRNFSTLYKTMPMIHCHCFTRELERDRAERDIRMRVEEKLGYPITEDVSFHLVRSVAPNKEMYCISFRLPTEVAFALST